MGDAIEVANSEQHGPMRVAPSHAGAESREPDARHRLVGKANVHRIGRWTFPVYELTQDGVALAHMGRTGWFRIYFGPGQRIELTDGQRWTVRSVGAGGAIRPVIVDSTRRKVAIAGLGHGTYGINGKDYACALYPAHKPRFGRANTWILRQFEDELAIITRHPASVEAPLPVHLGAVLLSLVLIRYGLPEESAPGIPSLRWGRR
jgi:hypothetical protein